MQDIIWFSDCSYKNKYLVGGKNASLGELYNLSQTINFNISNGFSVTTQLYKDFLDNNDIESKIQNLIVDINVSDIENINNISKKIKYLIKKSEFSDVQKKKSRKIIIFYLNCTKKKILE